MEIHWIATFLDPSFRELSFVKDKKYRLKQFKAIEDGLYSMVDDLKLEDLQKDIDTGESSNKHICENDNHDPFSNFRTKKCLTTHCSIGELLADEIIDYKTISAYNGDQRYQILAFWKHNERRLPILSISAKRILVIQASSSESERHFSSGGIIVNERRGCLSESSVESLIVLREAYLNETWPKSNTSNTLANQHDQQQQPQSITYTID